MKQGKNAKLLLVLFLSIILTITGCSSGTGNPGQDDILKIGLITPANGIDDPFYQKAWDGLEKAKKELGAKITYVKSNDEKDFPARLNDLKKQNCDLIFVSGAQNIPVILEAAEKNPGIQYICLNGTFAQPIPVNVLGVDFRVEEGAFLAGHIAGKMTQSNVLGFIMGTENQETLRYYYGYMAGIRSANGNNCELMKGLAATYTNKNRVQDVAESMLESGADVIFHVTGVAGKGMIKAVKEADKYAIGSDADQKSLAPDNVLTSVIRNHQDVIYDIVQQFKQEELACGRNVSYGLNEEGVMLANSTSEQIPDYLNNYILRLQDKISTGEMQVPSNEKEYFEFVEN